jgi:hypothetical protein
MASRRLSGDSYGLRSRQPRRYHNASSFRVDGAGELVVEFIDVGAAHDRIA